MPQPFGQSPTGRAALGALGASLAVYAALTWSFRGYTPDDAYIYFRYAQNWANGRGLVFNPGERVWGNTDVLWSMLLAMAAWARLDVVWTAKVAGALFGAACFPLAQALAGRLDWRAAIAAPLLLAGFIDLPYWSVSGMDSGLFAFAAALALLLTVRAAEGAGGGAAAAIAWAVAGTARPEGIGLGLVAMAWLKRRDWFVFAAVLAIWLAAVSLYYGDPIPNTFWAKRFDRVESFWRGLVFLRAFATTNDGALITLAIGAAIWLKRHVAIQLIAWLLAAYGAYLLWSGGDSWVSPNAFRFAVPVLVPISVAMAAGIAAAWDRMSGVRDWRVLLIAVAGAIAWLMFPSANGLVTRAVGGDPAIIAHLRAHSAPDDTLAVTDIGSFAYWTDLRVIDTFGLVDRHVARTLRKRNNSTYMPGDDIRLIDYLMARAPRWIILKGTAGPSGLAIANETAAPAIHADPRFARGYRFVMAGANEPYLLFERIAR